MAKEDSKKTTGKSTTAKKKASKKKSTVKRPVKKTTVKKVTAKKAAVSRGSSPDKGALEKSKAKPLTEKQKHMMIAEHAYYKWESAGYPTGQDNQHWLEAEQEIAAI